MKAFEITINGKNKIVQAESEEAIYDFFFNPMPTFSQERPDIALSKETFTITSFEGPGQYFL